MINFLIDNIFIEFGGIIFQQKLLSAYLWELTVHLLKEKRN